MKPLARKGFLGGSKVLSSLLLVSALILLLCSLLVLVSAPTSLLWVVAILASEWGHCAALIALAVALLAWRYGDRTRTTAGLALLSAVIFLSPVVRAAQMSGPFSFLDLFRGLPRDGVEVSEHAYALKGKKPLELDLYRPANSSKPLPLIVMIHGGSWRLGSKNQLTAMNRYLARRDFALASINYRHAPKWPFPAAVEDVFRAIEFLRTNAAELRLDTSRIVLIGRSAGGQLALSAAYAQREPAIRGVISFYAPTDLVVGYNKPSRRWVLDSKKVLEDYLGGSPAEKPEAYAVASPINFVNATTPPTLLIHGQLDPMVWPIHSELLAARLREANRPHFFLSLPWATHGCDANLSGPSGQLSLYAIERFLASVLNGDR